MTRRRLLKLAPAALLMPLTATCGKARADGLLPIDPASCGLPVCDWAALSEPAGWEAATGMTWLDFVALQTGAQNDAINYLANGGVGALTNPFNPAPPLAWPDIQWAAEQLLDVILSLPRIIAGGGGAILP